MSYHTIFEVSDRFPDAVFGGVAMAGLLAMVVIMLFGRSRLLLEQTSWVWLSLAGLIWMVLETRIIGGLYGPLAGALGVLPLIVAVLAWRDIELSINEVLHARARVVAPIVAMVVLALLSYEGACQWRAIDLESQLTSGHGTVVTGIVQGTANWNWSTESFSVDGHKYSFAETPTYVGFHQATSNLGPIHDGLNVRVTSIGDVIVRLEIADGQ